MGDLGSAAERAGSTLQRDSDLERLKDVRKATDHWLDLSATSNRRRARVSLIDITERPGDNLNRAVDALRTEAEAASTRAEAALHAPETTRLSEEVGVFVGEVPAA